MILKSILILLLRNNYVIFPFNLCILWTFFYNSFTMSYSLVPLCKYLMIISGFYTTLSMFLTFFKKSLKYLSTFRQHQTFTMIKTLFKLTFIFILILITNQTMSIKFSIFKITRISYLFLRICNFSLTLK